MSEREQDLTNTLIKVTTGRQVKAYFVQGHGEQRQRGQRPHGYSSVVDAAEARQLHRRQGRPRAVAGGCSRRCVGADHCRADGGLPEARSRRDQRRTCARAARRCSCSIRPSARSARPAPTLEALLKEWGITLGHDVVIDVSGMGQLLGTDASVPVVASYPQHPVTENFKLLTAFPLAQSVRGEAGVELGTANTQNLIQTSERSWSESDVKSLASGGKVSLDEAAGDHKGPITIALSLSMDAPDAPASAAAAATRASPLRRRSLQTAEAAPKTADAHHGRRRLRLRDRTPRRAFRATPICSST